MDARVKGLNPKFVGDISQSMIMAALLRNGYKVLMPFGDNFRYDLVTEADGVFRRVQCKTGRIAAGSIRFPVASSQYHRGGKREGYHGQVDAFGVFCPDNNKCYLIPIADLPLTRQAHLRLVPARNAQSKGLRWAQEYELQ